MWYMKLSESKYDSFRHIYLVINNKRVFFFIVSVHDSE